MLTFSTERLIYLMLLCFASPFPRFSQTELLLSPKRNPIAVRLAHALVVIAVVRREPV
ncbi:MAG: hypothetical protein K8T91_01150 [Planctomycetes bacterium]|nr:hypothetical protein [Planctomycetota bacterium]